MGLGVLIDRLSGHNRNVRFFTSDLHFGHENIIRYCNRPFDSVEDMNRALIENWNDSVTDVDEVWILGDVAMGQIVSNLPLVSELNGHKILVAGNHDRCWQGSDGDLAKWTTRYLDAGFEAIHQGTVDLLLGSHAVRAGHFPYEGDSKDEPRFTEWRPIDTGAWLLHGHVHTAWKVDRNQINVGVDVWNYRPVPETEILKILDRG